MRIFTLMMAAVVFCSSAALAEKGGRGHGKSKHDKHWEDSDRHHGRHKGDDDVRVYISGGDRVIIRDYIGHYYSHCPPGLAKKRNGCRPPGHVKHYRIGYPLEEYVVWEPVPRDLLVRLDYVPVGYQYVMVDRDVLLISEATKKVIDAITLYSAVGY